MHSMKYLVATRGKCESSYRQNPGPGACQCRVVVGPVDRSVTVIISSFWCLAVGDLSSPCNTFWF